MLKELQPTVCARRSSLGGASKCSSPPYCEKKKEPVDKHVARSTHKKTYAQVYTHTHQMFVLNSLDQRISRLVSSCRFIAKAKLVHMQKQEEREKKGTQTHTHLSNNTNLRQNTALHVSLERLLLFLEVFVEQLHLRRIRQQVNVEVLFFGLPCKHCQNKTTTKTTSTTTKNSQFTSGH